MKITFFCWTMALCFFAGCGDMWNEKRYDEGEFDQQREQVEDDDDLIQALPEEAEEDKS